VITTVIPYRGPSYIALRYASMKKTRPFTLQELFNCMHHKFKKPYVAGRSLDRLTNLGFLSRDGDTWRITEVGYDYLRSTTTDYSGEFK
jgi:hypothetical protein